MKTYHLSPGQILAISVLIVALGFVLLYLVGRGFAGKHLANGVINPEVEAITLARGELLENSADKALVAAEAALAKGAAVENTVTAPPSESKAEPVWGLADNNAPAPTLPLSDKIVSYEAIQVNPHPANFPAEGDRVIMPMLQGKKVVVEVQAVSINPNGDYTWNGHLQGFGDDYPVVMTYGDHSTFATITTPEGSYTMESVEGSGWLYKNPSMAEMSTSGTTDYREPPIAR